MKDLDIKKKVLSEIMGFMDEKEGERLKKHPKIMAAKIEMKKPELEIEKEDESDSIMMGEESEEELDPEMMKKLLEMYEEMKG